MELLEIDWIGAFYVIGFSFVMVFVLLILIVLILNVFGKIIASANKLPTIQDEHKAKSPIKFKTENNKNQLSTDDVAAIGMALFLYHQDIHDEESNVLTIKRVNRRYSPWSSKIFGLNTFVK